MVKELSRGALSLIVAASGPMLASCASAGASGPTAGHVEEASKQYIEASGIKIINVTDSVARQVTDAAKPALFSQELGPGFAEPTTIGPGDVVDITIVEAPPAVLFSGTLANSALNAAGAVRPNTVSSGLELPQQMVDLNGRISVPFAGSIQAAGRTPQQVEREIAGRLRGKARHRCCYNDDGHDAASHSCSFNEPSEPYEPSEPHGPSEPQFLGKRRRGRNPHIWVRSVGRHSVPR